MSIKYYQQEWKETIDNLTDIALIDSKPSFISRQMVKDKKEVFELFEHFA